MRLVDGLLHFGGSVALTNLDFSGWVLFPKTVKIPNGICPHRVTKTAATNAGKSKLTHYRREGNLD